MKRSSYGFTLLEMVVAIGIFAIIAAISYAGLDRFLHTRAMINERQNHLKLLHGTMVLMERDIRFMVNRSVRDGYGDSESALVSGTDVLLAEGEIVRLTTSQPDPEHAQAPRLQRVAWRLLDGELQRVTWAVLDRDQDSKEYVRTVLTDVAAITIHYFQYTDDDNLEAASTWVDNNALPAGVEFLLTLENGLEYRRVFTVAGSS